MIALFFVELSLMQNSYNGYCETLKNKKLSFVFTAIKIPNGKQKVNRMIYVYIFVI